MSLYHTRNDDDMSYTLATNSTIADHLLYIFYLWTSELFLRLGPIAILTVLNVLIIIKFYRIAKKKEQLKGIVVYRTSVTNSTQDFTSSISNGSVSGTARTKSVVSPLYIHIFSTFKIKVWFFSEICFGLERENQKER